MCGRGTDVRERPGYATCRTEAKGYSSPNSISVTYFSMTFNGSTAGGFLGFELQLDIALRIIGRPNPDYRPISAEQGANCHRNWPSTMWRFFILSSSNRCGPRRLT
jgi:hypothetical protein